jgi:hypothetical protein
MKMAIDQTTQAWAACIVTTVDEYVTDTCLMQYTQLLRPAMELPLDVRLVFSCPRLTERIVKET